MKTQVVVEIDVQNCNTAKILNNRIKDGWTLMLLTPIIGLQNYGREAAASETKQLIAVFEKEIAV